MATTDNLGSSEQERSASKEEKAHEKYLRWKAKLKADPQRWAEHQAEIRKRNKTNQARIKNTPALYDKQLARQRRYDQQQRVSSPERREARRQQQRLSRAAIRENPQLYAQLLARRKREGERRRADPVRRRLSIDGTSKARNGISSSEAGWFLLAIQNGRCAICKTDNPVRWHSDHCNATGKPRGVLCQHCNWLLGNAHDDVTILSNAITYLNDPPIQDFSEWADRRGKLGKRNSPDRG